MNLNAKIALEVDDGRVLLSVDSSIACHIGDVRPDDEDSNAVVAYEHPLPMGTTRGRHRVCASVEEAAVWVMGCLYDSGAAEEDAATAATIDGCTAKPEPAPPSLPRIGDKPPLEGWPRHR